MGHEYHAVTNENSSSLADRSARECLPPTLDSPRIHDALPAKVRALICVVSKAYMPRNTHSELRGLRLTCGLVHRFQKPGQPGAGPPAPGMGGGGASGLISSLTSEQRSIVLADVKPGEVLTVLAFAGTGKTTCLRAYAQARPHLRVLYLTVRCLALQEGLASLRCCNRGNADFSSTGHLLILCLQVGRMCSLGSSGL